MGPLCLCKGVLVTEQEFRRALLTPYWCKSPHRWIDKGIGIGHFALDARPGLFNLSWLMLQRQEPPPAEVYQNTDLRWVITLSGGTMLEGKSLMHHAAMQTERGFHAVIRRYASGRRFVLDIPGAVPWHTLTKFATRSLA
jgi:hypothetical protein